MSEPQSNGNGSTDKIGVKSATQGDAEFSQAQASVHKVSGRRQARRARNRFIALLGCIVVLATAIALMVPAISMTRGALVCGMEEHEHSDACYEKVLACGQEESEKHQHSEACYENQLVCGLSEHEHSDACYEDVSNNADESAVQDEGSSADEPAAQGEGSEESGNANASEASSAATEAAASDSGAASEATASADLAESVGTAAVNADGEPAVKEGADANAKPIQTFKADLKDEDDNVVLTVSVDAPEGALPADSFMKIDGVDAAKLVDEVKYAVDKSDRVKGNIGRSLAVDIAFYDKDGSKIEPSKNVETKIQTSYVRDFENPVLVHVIDRTMPSAKDKPKDMLAQVVDGVKIVDEDTMKFKFDEFSPFVIVEMLDAENADTPEAAGDEGVEAADAAAADEGAEEVKNIIKSESRPAQKFSQELKDDAGNVTVSVDVDAPEGALPENATMKLTPVTKKEVLDEVKDAAAAKTEIDASHAKAVAVDITFYDADSVEVEPRGDVHVTMSAPTVAKEDELAVVHVPDNDSAEIVATTATDPAAGTAEFDSASFSVYALVYTVDFHWEVDGEKYEYNLTGGAVASFRELIEALHLLDTVNKGALDNEGAATDLDAFIADISTITFSNEDLLRVEPVTENITAGGLKQKFGLETTFSSELSDMSKASLDAKVLNAPDWALVSLKPFKSNETLTITMKDGATFTVEVTDAQLSANVLTASGETYTITVSYDDEAEISEGAELKASEIAEESAEYQGYLKDSAAKLGLTGDSVASARFFDIKILDKGGKEIEPKSPVQVSIKYKQAMDLDDSETLNVVHFADEGLEVIRDIELSGDNKQVTYMQDSFSVTGTIINSAPTDGQQVMVLVKDDNRYFIVNNDASLTEVGYDQATNSVIVTEPMLWTSETTNDGNRHLYFHSEATGFGGDLIASDYYRRYLDPNSDSGWLQEQNKDSSASSYVTVTFDYRFQNQGEWIEANHIADPNGRVAPLNATNLNIDGSGRISHRNSDGTSGKYFAIERDEAGTPVRLTNQDGADGATQFIFATASKVPSGLHLDNAVNHIDISIQGDAQASVPLAYGNYYNADGDLVLTVSADNSVKLELTHDCVVNPEDLKITEEDMKRATITARDKNGNEINDAFYITGFSGNASTDISAVQVRVEGRFLCADLRGTQWEHIEGWRYDGYFDWNGWHGPDRNYVNTVRWQRLQNKVDYTVAVVKTVEYKLVHPDYGQLYDDEGHPLTIAVDAAFSGGFNYWDEKGKTDRNSGNECPPIQNNNDWRQGDIPSHDLSGMDFVLNGNTDMDEPPVVAIEIMKTILDDKGNPIQVQSALTSTFDVYQNKKADRNSVAGMDVEAYNGDDQKEQYADVYKGYERAFTKTTTIPEGESSAIVYSWNAPDGMYYVQERSDVNSLPQTIIDKNGDEWTYEKTYIKTEYVRRGDQYDDTTAYPDPMHISKTYMDRGEEYKSSPEVAGRFTTLDGRSKRSGFLEFFIYNVYTKGKKLEVEKKWDLPEGENALDGTEVTVDLYYAKSETNEFPEKSEYQKVIAGQGPFDFDTQTTYTLSEANDWAAIFENLPETMEEGDKTYNLDYYAVESKVTVPGAGGTKIDVTKGYKSTTSIGQDGKITFTNKREVVKLDAQKEWATGTEIPAGAEVTFELRYAVRDATNEEGEPIAIEDRTPWQDKDAYLPVKTQSGYADPFANDPRFDASGLTAEITLSVDDANSSGSRVWPGVFANLPKYLLTPEGKILEVDYYAVETAVTVSSNNVKDEYLVTGNKVDGDADDTDGTVTITNKKNVTSLDVEKVWVKGTPIPEGIELTAELRFAARMVADKNGAAVTPIEWPEKSEYAKVKDGENYADLFANDTEFNAAGKNLQTTVTLKADTANPANSWHASFENLPKFLKDAEGNVWEIDYYAVETEANVGNQDKIDDYTHTDVKVDSEAEDCDGTVTITNKETVTVEVQKNWEPEKPNGAEAVVQLKRFKPSGKPEMPKTEATVVKVWDDANNQDGKRPESVTMRLSNNQEVTLSESNNWTATVENLPEFTDEDMTTHAEYTWTEVTDGLPDGYSMAGTVTRGTVTTITNSYTPGKTSATVRVVWDDADNQDDKRPESVTAILDQTGQQVVLNEDNNWTATVTDLPEYSAGQQIGYTWTAQEELENSYTLQTPAEVEGTQTTLTYKHVPETTTATAKIIWDDENDKDGKRPASVELTLANDETKKVTVTADGNWEGSITGLPKNANGKEIDYSFIGPEVDKYIMTGSEKVEGVTQITYMHSTKDYVTVTIHTVLRNAPEGHYTDWENNGWSTNIYNVNAVHNGNAINDDALTQALGNGWGYQDKWSAGTKADTTFDVDKESAVSFHMQVGGESVSIVSVTPDDRRTSPSEISTGTTGVDLEFNSGDEDLDIYVVLRGEEAVEPDHSTVKIGVGYSTGDYNTAVSREVPLRSTVTFSYQEFTIDHGNWTESVDGPYEVYYWLPSENRWTLVSPEIKGEHAPVDGVSFNVGVKENYLILVKKDKSTSGNSGYQFELDYTPPKQTSTTSGASANKTMAMKVAPLVVEGNLTEADLDNLSEALDVPVVLGDESAAAKADETSTQNDADQATADTTEDTAATTATAPTSVKIAKVAKANAAPAKTPAANTPPTGYEEDAAFDTPTVTLTLNDTNGWKQSFPAQERYDRYGREYVYYVVEVSHTPEEFETKSITGDPMDGETVVITNAQEDAKLEITKAVTGDLSALPDGKNLTFTITGEGLGNGITKTYPTDFTNGTLTLTNEDGIKAGATYTVTESGTDMNLVGYTRTTTVTGTTGGTFNQQSVDPVAGTITAGTENDNAVISFENNYTQNKTSIPVSKSWNFANPSAFANATTDGWPNGATVTVKLYQTVAEHTTDTGKTLELTATKQSGEFADLPTHASESPITYTVEEATVTGADDSKFTTAISGNETEGYTITNTEKTAGLTITKSFTGATLTAAQKENITFKVEGPGLPDGGITKTYAEFTEGVWTLTQADGIKAGETYTVTETNANVEHFTRATAIQVNEGEATAAGESVTANVPVSAEGEGSINVTNEYALETTTVSGTKAWVDAREHNNASEIVLTLLRKVEGQTDEEFTPVADVMPTWDGNTYTFSNLPAYVPNNVPATTDDGKPYVYKVEETAVNVTDGGNTVAYKQEVDGSNFINTELMNIEATKTWKDGDTSINGAITNATVIFKLQQKVGETDWQDVAVEAPNENPKTLQVDETADSEAWRAIWNDLPKYVAGQDGGQAVEIQYRVVETEAKLITADQDAIDVKPTDNPSSEIVNGAANIDNVLPKTQIRVTKEWKDSAGVDQTFDSDKSITFELHQVVGETDVVYTQYEQQGIGTIGYTPSVGWATVSIPNLPKYVYDDSDKCWREATYYVVEINPANNVTVSYKLGDTQKSNAAAAATAGAESAENADPITIVNTENAVSLSLLKQDETDATNLLAGAEFVLNKIDPNNEGTIEVLANTTQTTTTVSDGTAQFDNLTSGYYELKETNAPAGFVLQKDMAYYFKVEDGAIKFLSMQKLVAPKDWQEDNSTTKPSFANGTLTITNTPGKPLPNTGGSGTMALTVLGSALVLAGAAALVRNRRKRGF